MKIEIDLDAKYSEPSILIRAKELTPELNDVIKAFNASPTHSMLLGYQNDQAHLIQMAELIRIQIGKKFSPKRIMRHICCATVYTKLKSAFRNRI